jgi:glycosyltransferase involved in cell wall biosynthesis
MGASRMKIKVFTNFVGGGWDPWSSFLRGTENFVREFATIAAREHEVTVYHNGELHGEYKGVSYLDHKEFRYNCDLLLIVKVPELVDNPEIKRVKGVLFYTNTVDEKDKLLPRRVERMDKIYALSNWHKDNLLGGVDKVEVLYHGIYPEKYKGGEKKKNLCIYTSSPDRGLQHLRGFWPKIKEQVPDAELITAYNGKSEAEMVELYRKADFWLYPCCGGELYCISGIEAQASGCFPVHTGCMALEETVRFGTKTTLQNFVKDTVMAMKNRELVEKEREKMIEYKYPSHEDVYNQIMAKVV